MTEVTITEQNVMDLLIESAKGAGENAPRAIVVNRVQSQMSITRTVRIALVVSTNNETLVDALIQTSLENDFLFNFVGSDVNLQSNMEVDYLFFEATIMRKQ